MSNLRHPQPVRIRSRFAPAIWAWVLAAAFAVPAKADVWSTFATISSTMGVSESRLCVGEGSRGDIGCPAYAPSLTTAGDISITRNISAAKFIGDGSLLTGLIQPVGDRISTTNVVSGSNLAMAVANQGTISFTLGGVAGVAYLHSSMGLVTPGISTTNGPVSTSLVYFAPVASAAGVSVTLSAADFDPSDRIVSTSANVLASSDGTVRIGTGGVSSTAYFNGVGQLVAPGVSTTGTVSATVLSLSNNPPNACNSTSRGTIKVINGKIFVCRE